MSNTEIDILENDIQKNAPELLELLLLDRTKTGKKKHYIIWANDNYIKYGTKQYPLNKYFSATNEIIPEVITGANGSLIRPRSLKNQDLKKERTKAKAEVFTPTWVVKLQNDEVDKNYSEDGLKTYINRKWLEITCGEAPYMTTRYDMETGEYIEIKDRVGFVDRKLARINKEVTDPAEWQKYVEAAYKSSYGFEWNGDSLLLARENLLYTYRDYYYDKWKKYPSTMLLEEIANIISYNVFQMDGLKYEIPLSEKKKKKSWSQEVISIDEKGNLKVQSEDESFEIKPGKPVKIMNWETGKMERFDKELA